MKIKKKIVLIISLVLVLVFTACEKDITKKKLDDVTPGISKLENENHEEKDMEEGEEIVELEEVQDPKEIIDLSLKPNEVGQVMILMYHNIGEEEEEWTRTPENFYKDLVNLYEKGYRAVSLEDYVNDNMDVEAGKTPVVITFDDGNENNFRIIEGDNEEKVIDPNSAIGILEDFKKEYPDFNTTASFFIFGSNAFRQPEYLEYKLNFLIDNGYSIGNHTIDHRGMKGIQDKEIIQEAIGKQVGIINDVLPGYEVNTYALCYGQRPSEDLEVYLEKGSYESTDYKNIAILNVGWNPALSPLDLKFNQLSLPRIRASEMKVDNVGIYNWIEYFENNPSKRYISDGVKEVVTIPKDKEEIINTEKLGDKELYIYEND